MSQNVKYKKIQYYISQTINEFGIKVLSAITTDGKVISPLFLSSAFGMLQLVSKESVINNKLREYFGYNKHNITDNEVHNAYENLLQQICGANSIQYVLNLANGVMVQNALHLDVLHDYSIPLKINYDASIQFADFANDGQKAIETVNKWVADKTSGKIRSLFKAQLPLDTRLVIVNAVYFRGNWLKKFDQQLTDSFTFYNNGNTYHTIHMMKMFHTEYNITRRDIDYQLDADIVELPFNDCDISMYIVLPHTLTGLHKTVSLLTEQKLNSAIKYMGSEIIDLYLPRFSIKVRYTLVDELKTLGLENIFTDLSGINCFQGLTVSDVVHRVFLEFNENGCEYVATTGSKMELNRHYTQTTRQFKVDHPFIFVIRDKKNDLNLFYGQINEIN